MCIAVRHFACGAKEHFYSPNCTLATCKKQISNISLSGNCFICAERHKATTTPVSIPRPKPGRSPITTSAEAYAVMANAHVNDARGNNVTDLLSLARTLIRHFDYYLSLEANCAMNGKEGEEAEGQMDETEKEVKVIASNCCRNENGNGNRVPIIPAAKVNNQELEDCFGIQADKDAATLQQEGQQYGSGSNEEGEGDEEVTPSGSIPTPNSPRISIGTAENYSFCATVASAPSSSPAQPEQQQQQQQQTQPDKAPSTSASTGNGNGKGSSALTSTTTSSRRARRLARQRRADVRRSGIWKKPKEN